MNAEDRMVISNAKRLVRDAELLKDHERYASAYALAILGLEEIGKVILKRWGEPDKERRWHLSKQMAVSSLLIPARCKGCNGGRNGSFQRDSQ